MAIIFIFLFIGIEDMDKIEFVMVMYNYLENCYLKNFGNADDVNYCCYLYCYYYYNCC
jgi:hypothetical protein